MYFGVGNLIRQWGHRSGGWWRDSAAMTMRRMAGSVGLGGPCLFLFFPLYLVEALMLQEGVSDHRHQRVSVQTLP